MKFISRLFLWAILVSILLSPITELLCYFSDIMKIDAAITAASRAALMTGDDYSFTRDADTNVKYNDGTFESFENRFNSSFRKVFNLNPYNKSKDGKYNSFSITITPDYWDRENDPDDRNSIDSKTIDGKNVYNKFKILVSTEYKFKTELMKRFYENVSSSSKVVIERNKVQKLSITN